MGTPKFCAAMINAPNTGETKIPPATRVIIRVPEESNTFKEAVDRVHGDDRFTTIVLGKGEHQIDGDYLEWRKDCGPVWHLVQERNSRRCALK